MNAGSETRWLQRDEVVGLREPRAADEREYLGLRRDSADFHRPWEPLPAPGVDPYAAESYARYLRNAEDDARLCTLVCRVEDGAIVGALNYNEIIRGPLQSAFLGYWIGAAFARRGYMTRALRLALDHAFGPLALHRVEANVRPENAASIALVQRLGFRREGFSPRYVKIAGAWCDHERYAMLADEWPAEAAARAARA